MSNEICLEDEAGSSMEGTIRCPQEMPAAGAGRGETTDVEAYTGEKQQVLRLRGETTGVEA